jgi:hypothetical protein
MGQKHKIRYGYQTGNSYGSESLESELEMVWENLDVAKENLQRIKEHYRQYKDLTGWSFGDKIPNQEILKENQNKDWFVKKEKYAFFGKKNPNDYSVIGEDRYKALKEKGENVGTIISQEDAQYNIILKTDGGKNWQFWAPWCGYFESLEWAEIVVDNSDMRIEF